MESRQIRILAPKISAHPPQIPMIFVDTCVWHTLLSSQDLCIYLQQACRSGALQVALSELVLAELALRSLKEKVEELCGGQLCVVPANHVTANQIIQSFLRFVHGQKEIVIPWELVTREPAVLGKGLQGLGPAVDVITRELGKLRSVSEDRVANRREDLVASVVDVERTVWKDILLVYADIVCAERGTPVSQYEDFFWTDFFTDLPAILFVAYLLGYTLADRQLQPNDIVDILTLAELLPYVSYYFTDKDLATRLKRITRDYPEVFSHYIKRSNVVAGREDTEKTLRFLLESR